MSLFIRLFNLSATVFFVLWIILHLLELYDLSLVCLYAVAFFALCIIAIRIFFVYKITRRRLKQ